MNSIEVIGVYHANGGLLGEISYVLGKVFGQTECALCVLTHTFISEKSSLKTWRCELPYRLSFKHLNELSSQMASCVVHQSPCVVLEYESKLSILIDAESLRSMNGDEHALMRCIESRVASFTSR